MTVVTVDSFVMSSRRPHATTVAAGTLNASSPGALCFGVAAFNNSPFVQSLRAQTSARKQARIGAPSDEMTESTYRQLIVRFVAILKHGVQYDRARTAVQNNGVRLDGGHHGGSDQDWLSLQDGIVSVFISGGGRGRDVLNRIFQNVLEAFKPNDMADITTTEQLHDYITREGTTAARYNAMYTMGRDGVPLPRRQNAVPHGAPPLTHQDAFHYRNGSPDSGFDRFNNYNNNDPSNSDFMRP